MTVVAYQPHGDDPNIPPGVVTVRRLADLQPIFATDPARTIGPSHHGAATTDRVTDRDPTSPDRPEQA